MLKLPVPEAEYHNVSVEPSEMQKDMVASLAERAEKVRVGGVDASVDNMLKITNDGRKLALDQRMLNEMPAWILMAVKSMLVWRMFSVFGKKPKIRSPHNLCSAIFPHQRMTELFLSITTSERS